MSVTTYGKADENIQAKPERIEPTLFIGLGGTGMKVLARFRQRMADMYGTPDQWPCHGMIGIDTDEDQLLGGGRSSGGPAGQNGDAAGQRGFALNDRSLVNIGMSNPEWRLVLNNLQSRYPHMDAWMPPSLRAMNALSLTKGAGQIRAAGRACFIFNVKKVMNAIDGELNRLLQTATINATGAAVTALGDQKGRFVVQNNGKVKVVLIAGTGGGTGSGSVLDCAFLLQYMRNELHRNISDDVDATLLLPDAFTGDFNDQTKVKKANTVGYALLRELEHHSSRYKVPFDASAWGMPEVTRGLNDPPFRMCYLISGTNAANEKVTSASDLYDMMADHLVVTTLGTKLGGEIAGIQSNAQTSLFNESGFGDPYPASYDLGGRDRDKVNPDEHYFDQEWSGRFSSMGVASITMKKDELKRIGGCVLLREMIAREVGQTGKTAADEVMAEVRVSVTELQAPGFQTPESSKRIKTQIDIGASATSPGAVDAAVGTLLNTFRAIATELQTPETASMDGSRVLIQRATAAAKDRARATFHRLQSTLGSAPYRGLMQLRSGLDERIKWARGRRIAVAAGEPTYPKSNAIIGLAEIAAHRGRDLFKLKRRSLVIYHGELRDTLTKDFDTYATAIESSCANIYYTTLASELAGYSGAVQQWVATLGEWADKLAETQNRIAHDFKLTRNQVLTEELAVPTASDRQGQLREEIDAAIDKRLPGSARGDRLGSTLGWTLNSLEGVTRPSDNPGDPAVVLRAKHLHELSLIYGIDRIDDVRSRIERTVAYDLLRELPREQNIFKLLQRKMQEKGWVLDDIVSKVKRAASAAWKFHPTAGNAYEQKGGLSTIRKVAAAHPAAGAQEVIAAVQNSFERDQPAWSYLALNDDDARFAGGDLVAVHEMHGLSIASLENIRQMQNDYERSSYLEQQYCHLNYTNMGLLPDLVPMDDQKLAQEIIDLWDLATLAIVLGLLPWSETDKKFVLSRPGVDRPRVLGASFREAAAWLGRNKPDCAALRDDVSLWFEQQIAKIVSVEQFVPERVTPNTPADQAAGMIVAVERILTLIRDHSVLNEIGNDERSYLTPEGTMLNRIQRGRLEEALQQVRNHVSEGGEAIIRDRVSNSLHNAVRFIGNRPSNPRTPKGKILSRFLQLLRSEKGNPAAVLTEAYNDKWKKEAVVPGDLKSLFPYRESPQAGEVVGHLL